VTSSLRGRCDECGVSFDVDMKEEPQEGGGVVITFSCPNGHRFDIARISKRGLRLRAELNRLRDQQNPANARQIRRLQERYEREYIGLASKEGR